MTALVGGVGIVNVDLLYNNMKRIPKPGEEIYTDDFSMELGGGVPATLINLSRLGVKTQIITFLGQDMFSEYAKQSIKNYGVEISNLYSGNKIPLTITSVLILKGDRSFVSYCNNEAVSCFGRNVEKIYDQLKNCKIVYMNYGFIDVYKRLKKEGITLILDTGWEDDLSIEKYKEYLEIADYYVPNRKEALKITGKETIKEAAEVLQEFFQDVIIKLDKEGCLLKNKDGYKVIDPIEITEAVDSTGAGDAFLSGLMYGLCKHYPIERSIVFGNITGGMCVKGVGALSSFITESDMLEMSENVKIKEYRLAEEQR